MVRQTPLGAADDGAHGSLPAAYTYLGQFVAHDLSMGVPSPSMAAGDPAGSIGLRRPALNLDSLYGGGPVLQPYLFERSDSGQFRLGTLREGSREDLGDAQSRFDVPRLDDGQAVIAEPRNDQTLLIGQLHVALLAFHKRVKTKLPGASDAARFHAAQREVCWHYQWLVVHYWLARVLAPGTVLRVLDEGPRLCPKRDARRQRRFHWSFPQRRSALATHSPATAIASTRCHCLPAWILTFPFLSEVMRQARRRPTVQGRMISGRIFAAASRSGTGMCSTGRYLPKPAHIRRNFRRRQP